MATDTPRDERAGLATVTGAASQGAPQSPDAAPDRALGTMSSGRPVQRWRRLLQGKLRRQVTIPVLIGLIQLAIALVELVDGQAPPAVLFWFLPALLVGFGFGRATRVVWDTDATQLVLVGGQVVLTVAWLLAQAGSKTVLPNALNGLSSAGVIALLVASGLVVGHSLGLLGQIRDALRRQAD